MEFNSLSDNMIIPGIDGPTAKKIGDNHYFGENGVQKDLSQAAKWYLYAARLGVPDAESYMGYLYKKGEGVPQDINTAIEWYCLAAEHGYVPAQLTLYCIYNEGDGVPQNNEKALKYLRMAAENGSTDAKFDLALDLFDDDKCTDSELDKVVGIMTELDSQQYVRASFWLGKKYYYGFTPRLNDQKKGVEYLLHAAYLGNADAAATLGKAYEDGKGVDRDVNKAFEYYCFAYDYGCFHVMYDLAGFYNKGISVEADVETGLFLLNEYLKKLNKNDERYAITQRTIEREKQRQQLLCPEDSPVIRSKEGSLSGTGITSKFSDLDRLKDNNAWAMFYNELENCPGSSEKYYALGYMYFNGFGVERDMKKSYECFRKSAFYSFDNADTLKWLGYFFEAGIVVDKDNRRAFDFYSNSYKLSSNDWVKERMDQLTSNH